MGAVFSASRAHGRHASRPACRRRFHRCFSGRADIGLAATEYDGLFRRNEPCDRFFYLITGLHGLHLLGGLVAWGRTFTRVWGDFDVARIRHSVELCTLYWHYLLGIWLVLFGLLFSGNNLDILLKLCGIR